MKIYVSKIKEGFKVHCPELQILKNEIHFIDNIETIDSESVANALCEFNDCILREFIEYYFLECKPTKEEISSLFNNFTFEYVFDNASFKNHYLDNPTVYGLDDDDTGDISTENKTKKESEKPNSINNTSVDSRFRDKKIFVNIPLFGKTTVSFSTVFDKLKGVEAKQQTSINKDTNIAVFMGKKEPPADQLKKIEKLNNDGANIEILSEIEFVKALGIKVENQ